MANFNKVLMLGRLTRDPQLSYTPNQTAVVDFGVATNRRWAAQDGSQREETCFVDCRAFGRQAENINKYLTKGSLVFIEGRLTFDSWTAQDGTKRSKHRVTVVNSQFLPGTGGPGGDRDPGGPAGSQPTGQPDGGAGSQPTGQPEGGATGGDDIPF